MELADVIAVFSRWENGTAKFGLTVHSVGAAGIQIDRKKAADAALCEFVQRAICVVNAVALVAS
jgi:hypothetical protein